MRTSQMNLTIKSYQVDCTTIVQTNIRRQQSKEEINFKINRAILMKVCQILNSTPSISNEARLDNGARIGDLL